jgi:hypothetical protein
VVWKDSKGKTLTDNKVTINRPPESQDVAKYTAIWCKKGVLTPEGKCRLEDGTLTEPESFEHLIVAWLVVPDS